MALRRAHIIKSRPAAMRQAQPCYALKALTIHEACFTLKPLPQWRGKWSTERDEQMSTVNLAAIVDELGELKAAIAELTEKEKELKTIIAASGYAEFDGELFRATVSK